MSRISYRTGKTHIFTFKWDIEVVVTNDEHGYVVSKGWYCSVKAGACHVGFPGDTKSVVVFAEIGTEGQLTHEAYHVVCSIYATLGIKRRDEESFAYLLEDVVDSIMEVFKCIKNKKKRFIAKNSRRMIRGQNA